jgi:hypothetical protein
MSTKSHAAIQMHLASKQIDLVSVDPDAGSGESAFSGEIWHRISVPGFDELHDVHVAVPVSGRVTVGPKQQVQVTAMSQPSTEDVSEVTAFVKSLAAQGQIEGVGKPSASRPTHRIKTDGMGHRRLVRKGYSAV